MEAIRQYATVHNNTLTLIHLPDKMNEMEVEIIVMPKDEYSTTGKRIKLSSLKGSMIPESENSIDTQLKSIRDEWERPLF